MTALLAIETSTDACSVALWVDHQLTTRFAIQPQQHTQLILTMCDELLHAAGIAPAMLEAIAFGCGPGSFVGARLAASVTQGIAYAQQLPVVPVSSLQALAQVAYQRHGATQVFATIDARMGQVYAGMYHLVNGTMQLINKEFMIATDALIIPSGAQWFCVGMNTDHLLYPSAEGVMALAIPRWQKGLYVGAQHALPVYLREAVQYNATIFSEKHS